MTDTDRVGSSAAGGPAHSARPAPPRLRTAAAAAGIIAVAAAIAIAVPTLRGGSAPAASTLTTARSLTVTVPQAVVPLTASELTALLQQPADLGALQTPARLGSCLGGLGYPTSTTVLGARTVDINGRPAVVLLIAAENPTLINAFAVSPNCSAADTGLLADTVVPRP